MSLAPTPPTLFDLPGEARPDALVRNPRWSSAEREAAILEAVPQVKAFVYGFLRKSGSPFDRAERDDLVGEALAAVCALADKFDPSGSAKFPTYCLGYLKKRTRGEWVAAVKERSFAARGVDLDAVACAGPGAERRDDDDDEVGGPDGPTPADLALLDRLPPTQREVVWLFAFEGLAPHQIGQRLGMPVKDVKLLQRQAAGLLAAEKARGQTLLFQD